MREFELTPEELQELRAAHREARRKKAKDAYKLNAVILLGTGWLIDEVAEALLLDRDTVSDYVSRYRQGGIKSLLAWLYVSKKPQLSDDQLRELEVELDRKIYLNTQQICDYVSTTFGVSYSLSGMTKLLHRMNYVFKKPKLCPGKPDKDLQEQFVECYVDFMSKKSEKEAVFFVDAVHAVHNSLVGYGWIKKGSERDLKANAGRERFNIHGAMNAETFETVTVMGDANVDSSSTIELFELLEKLYPLATTIYVILDNAKYHFSREVQAWVEKSRIKMVNLPAYSPELNMIERLWRVFKTKVLRNVYYENFKEFKKACSDFFINQNDYIDSIQSIMGDGLAAYAEE